MTMAAGRQTDGRVERSCARYRSLLIAYPRSFRDEYGEDLVQAFRDLLLMGDGQVWWRTARDFVTSVPREQVAAWRGGKRPSWGLLALALVLLIPLVLTRRFALELYLMIGALLVLPVLGISTIHHAVVVRRSTGAPVAGRVALGISLFVPGIALLVWIGPDRGWVIGATLVLASIVGGTLAVVGGIAALVRARREGRPASRSSWVAAGAGAFVLLGLIGAAYNSYRNSLPPPGDHSVANASAETRQLWTAAKAGDVTTVKRLAATCADPWVQFPTPDGKHDARGVADMRLLDLPDDQEPPYATIKDILGDAKSTWSDRCGPA
jgi:hypothetical protein